MHAHNLSSLLRKVSFAEQADYVPAHLSVLIMKSNFARPLRVYTYPLFFFAFAMEAPNVYPYTQLLFAHSFVS